MGENPIWKKWERTRSGRNGREPDLEEMGENLDLNQRTHPSPFSFPSSILADTGQKQGRRELDTASSSQPRTCSRTASSSPPRKPPRSAMSSPPHVHLQVVMVISRAQAGEVPSGFPFQIEDLPGQQTVTLKREYQGETIEVIVQMPSLISGDDVEQDNSGSDDNNENGNQSSIPLIVNVSKRNGPSLEFGVTAFPDEIAIESLSVKNPDLSEDQIAYEGPDFSDLDENLQKAFHKYLEIRGIKPSTTNFLHEYMIEKDNREYIRWMKNLKNFVQS